MIRTGGTVASARNTDVTADAESLHEHVQSMAANPGALFALLAARSAAQRLEIARDYEAVFGHSVLETIGPSTDALLKHVLTLMLADMPQFYAECVWLSMAASTTNPGMIETVDKLVQR